jgi:hypothetical protein
MLVDVTERAIVAVFKTFSVGMLVGISAPRLEGISI